MTIEQLQYAFSVYQRLSFVKAAEESFVSQPALTMQVKKLEEEIGFPLFDRARKPLKVTPAGKKFMEKAQETLLSFKGLEQLATELNAGEQDHIKVGIIPTLAPFLLPLFVRQFHKQYPKLELHINELTTEEVLQLIQEGELDAGIIVTPVVAKGLSASPLFYEQFYLYVADDHPYYKQKAIRLSDIKAKDLWLLKEGNCFRSQVNDLCQLGKKNDHQHFTYQSSSISSLMRIVEHQGGVTFVPELATLGLSAEQENMLKPIKGDKVVREISLIRSRFFHKQRALDKLQQLILENIPSHMKQAKQQEIVDSFVSI
ncbi:LysR substrate-binding domain-containing protein [Porifericola rhodea]|uniref:hydrogen peroxide-inducible genes activator n=1 Tax=Porifericola rhodea TaxID=930972 RepID=UPI0026670ABB|nr:hydrogen peroxide-inducible genes activator [Porifericola rhodea]WKN29729.1 LysR substrate-binding domain-containing protein [Porifericola rhodea]